MTMKCDKH